MGNIIFKKVLGLIFLLAGNVCFAQDFSKIILKERLSIGSEKSDELFQWAGICTDDEGNIYVTDVMDYMIKKFDRSGIRIKSTGAKGQGPGEFSGPIDIKYFQGRLYVRDIYTQGLSVFDKELKYITKIIYPNTRIMHFKILSLNELLIAPYMMKLPFHLVSLDSLGQERGIINFAGPHDDSYFTRGMEFEVDAKKDIYIMYRAEDVILKINFKGELLWKRSLYKNKKVKIKKFAFGKSQTQMLFKGVQLDTLGNVFILGGHLAKNSSRDIFVLAGQDGHVKTTFTLPEPSHTIFIDADNYLYSRSAMGTCLKQYEMIYQ